MSLDYLFLLWILSYAYFLYDARTVWKFVHKSYKGNKFVVYLLVGLGIFIITPILILLTPFALYRQLRLGWEEE